MKTLYLSIIAIVGIGIVVISFFIFFFFMTSNPSQTYSTAPIIDEYWDNTTRIDIAQASTLAGFSVKPPSKIPENYTLQISSIKKIENYPNVYLFYSKVPITNKMTLDDFFDKGGFWVMYRNEPYVPNNKTSIDKWMSDSLAVYKTGWNYNVLVTAINGYSSIAFDQNYRDGGGGQKIHDPSLVDFITNDSRITIQGNLPKEELIQVGESIK